jgi:large subunit ribosomal protein L3
MNPQLSSAKTATFGVKIGMSQFFREDGTCVPVTLLQVGPHFVTQVKTKSNDGYSALQLSMLEKKPQRTNKPLKGHFAKAEKGCFYFSGEVRITESDEAKYKIGDEQKLSEDFQVGSFIDVAGTSIGRGFAGVVRRYGMKGQPATRGTHEARRHVGSIGCRKTPGRVHKNKRMPGHMGNALVSVQNLKIEHVRSDLNVILVRGAVPGAKGAIVSIKQSVKKTAIQA